MLIGILVGIVCCCFFRPPLWVGLVLLWPLAIDGTVQRMTSYESTNIRRLITGLLWGYGFVVFEVMLHIAAYRFGHSLTH